MRLLFLTPQLPHPPRQGTALRNWGLIRGLARRHEITLLSFAEGDQTVDETLAAACRRIVTVPVPRRTRADRVRTILLSGDPDMALRLASGEFRRALRELGAAESFDAANVEAIELAAYLPAAAAALRERGVLIYDAHNAETLLQQRAFETDRRSPSHWPGALYSLIQSRRLARFEAWTLRHAGRVLCVSVEDARSLQSLVPAVEPIIIPNGIDLSEYDTAAVSRQRSVVSPQPSVLSGYPSAIVFTGKMDYRPNVDAALWFADEIFPRVRAARPEAQFVIAGQRPHSRLDALRTRAGIVLTGEVPDLRPYLAAAALYVAPLRMGGGTRFKLLEAMALGKAIVSTRLGAEGFPVTDGREVVLADEPADFAAAVLALLADDSRRAVLGEAARRFVENGYDWSAIIPRLEAVYDQGKLVHGPHG